MTKALVGHPFGSRKNVSNMNWPRKFRVEISTKFVTKGSRRGGQAQILTRILKS